MASPRTRKALQELKSVDDNAKCFECGTHSPQVSDKFKVTFFNFQSRWKKYVSMQFQCSYQLIDFFILTLVGFRKSWNFYLSGVQWKTS